MKNGEMNPHRNTLIFNNFDDSTRLRLYKQLNIFKFLCTWLFILEFVLSTRVLFRKFT